ncbi:hypothetical protein ACLOJK_024117, partial [Asimina triloba]
MVPYATYVLEGAKIRGPITMGTDSGIIVGSSASTGKGTAATTTADGAEASWANGTSEGTAPYYKEEVELGYLEATNGQCEELHEAEDRE